MDFRSSQSPPSTMDSSELAIQSIAVPAVELSLPDNLGSYKIHWAQLLKPDISLGRPGDVYIYLHDYRIWFKSDTLWIVARLSKRRYHPLFANLYLSLTSGGVLWRSVNNAPAIAPAATISAVVVGFFNVHRRIYIDLTRDDEGEINNTRDENTVVDLTEDDDEPEHDGRGSEGSEPETDEPRSKRVEERSGTDGPGSEGSAERSGMDGSEDEERDSELDGDQWPAHFRAIMVSF
jgi:hypothetical protein